MQSDNIHRHPDGSIDVEFYRRGAHRMRAQAMREFITAATTRKAGIVAAIVIAAVVVAGSALRFSADGLDCCAVGAQLTASQTVTPTVAERR